MSKLISGKEAVQSFINGEQVEFLDKTGQWRTMLDNTILKVFLDHTEFRLKPRTITINGVELAPCYAVGIDHIKNEVSIQFHNNEDAVKLNSLLLNIYGFRNA